MIQSGQWKKSKTLNLPILLQLLTERFESLDFEQAKMDVRPFIKNQNELSLWNKTFFNEIVKEYQSAITWVGRGLQLGC